MSWFSRIFKTASAVDLPAANALEPALAPEKLPELTPLQTLAMEQVTSYMHQVNESLQIANNSTNPETKVSRLEFARARLMDMQLLAQRHSFIKLQRLESVQRTIAQLAKEFSEAGYHANTDQSSQNYRQGMQKNIDFPIDDIAKGWKFSATIQLRTPLRVLTRHGEIYPYLSEPPPIARAMWEGFWSPLLKSNLELGMPDLPEVVMRGRTMTSDVGPIPLDGGEYLKFLLKVRAIVEVHTGVEMRRADLREELRNPQWSDFCRKLGGEQAVANKFFPSFVETIKGLPENAVAALWERGLTTPAQIAAVDTRLLDIKGISPAKLKLIQFACAAAIYKESKLVDLVER